MRKSPRRAVRVLIADASPVVREGLRSIIDREPDLAVIGQAKDGRVAVTMAHRLRPDVVVLDARLPVLDGVGTLVQLKRRRRDVRVILLVPNEGDEDVYRGLRQGARGCLLKESELRDIVKAIRTVHSGRTVVAQRIGDRLARRLSAEELTDREYEVLDLMTTANSNKEIGATLGISVGSIKTHIRQIFRKLGVKDRTHAVTHALRRGLVRLPQDVSAPSSPRNRRPSVQRIVDRRSRK